MESLLASIRKAIDSDIGKNTKSPPPAAHDTSFRGAMRESRVRYDDEPPLRRDASEEISDLRNKILKNRQSAGFTEPVPRLPSRQRHRPPLPGPLRNRALPEFWVAMASRSHRGRRGRNMRLKRRTCAPPFRMICRLPRRTTITAAMASRKSIRQRWAGRRTNRPLRHGPADVA